jgi:hypothetical protein
MRASVVRLPAKTAPKTGERLRPLHIPGTEALTVKQALEVFKDYRLSEDTLRRLVKQFNSTSPIRRRTASHQRSRTSHGA